MLGWVVAGGGSKLIFNCRLGKLFSVVVCWMRGYLEPGKLC